MHMQLMHWHTVQIFAKCAPDGWCRRKSKTNPSRRQQWVSTQIGVIESATNCNLFGF